MLIEKNIATGVVYFVCSCPKTRAGVPVCARACIVTRGGEGGSARKKKRSERQSAGNASLFTCPFSHAVTERLRGGQTERVLTLS